jgi:hypothetical protein
MDKVQKTQELFSVISLIFKLTEFELFEMASRLSFWIAGRLMQFSCISVLVNVYSTSVYGHVSEITRLQTVELIEVHATLSSLATISGF